MSKELYIAAHEELIGEYLERHPEATEAEAYDKCADRAYDHMVDKLADQSDYLRKARQEDIANGQMQARRAQKERDEAPTLTPFEQGKVDHNGAPRVLQRVYDDGDTCGDCGVGADEHAEDCPRLARLAEEWPR